MDKVLSSVQEYIKSGEYFVDAKRWYNFEYIYPLVHRTFLLIFSVVLFVLFLSVVINFETLLPVKRQVRYAISAKSLKSATITNANHIKHNAINSIADIMIRNYVIHRESYDYDLLRPQYIFMQNNSTRIIFRQFANFMNIDNPLSPVMRYQKSLKRSVNISSVVYHKNNKAEVTFTSLAKNASNDILENMVWQATINFEIDAINIHLPPNSRFNFAVTGYKLKLIEDKSKKIR
ncbi:MULTISPECIES: VirB8/TrbF family protein [unclassified Candidatus Tisiphia]|jgi:type IV secretion system protein VirB8|uniref:VirB8/TrbF family protein n=1 Tax=unclassified Candidatus Tisiphia TaxID=2996318 RepID=UPI002835C1C9|nr:virB8 family protein [Rickettsia sp.]